MQFNSIFFHPQYILRFIFQRAQAGSFKTGLNGKTINLSRRPIKRIPKFSSQRARLCCPTECVI